MRASAIETMQSFYGEEISLERDWKAAEKQVWTQLPSILEMVVDTSSDLGRELRELLAQSGSVVSTALTEEIQRVSVPQAEQEASIELRRRFGVVKTPLAFPVFIDLARDEVVARTVVKSEAIRSQGAIDGEVSQVVNTLQLFFADRLNAVLEEQQAHEFALAESIKASSDFEVLGPVMDDATAQFDSKLETLSEEAMVLEQVLFNLDSLIRVETYQAVESTIMSAARQNTTFTRITA